MSRKDDQLYAIDTEDRESGICAALVIVIVCAVLVLTVALALIGIVAR